MKCSPPLLRASDVRNCLSTGQRGSPFGRRRRYGAHPSQCLPRRRARSPKCWSSSQRGYLSKKTFPDEDASLQILPLFLTHHSKCCLFFCAALFFQTSRLRKRAIRLWWGWGSGPPQNSMEASAPPSPYLGSSPWGTYVRVCNCCQLVNAKNTPTLCEVRQKRFEKTANVEFAAVQKLFNLVDLNKIITKY